MWQFQPLNYSSAPNPSGKDFRNTPEFARHRKKVRIIAVILPFIIVGLIALGIFGLFSSCKVSQKRNEQLYKNYQNDENYLTVTGTLDEFYYYKSYRGVSAYYFTLTGSGTEIESATKYAAVDLNGKILESNGFNRDITIGKSIITVIFSKCDLYGNLPVIEVYMDGKCYLDRETGKTNLLNYIEEKY